jgi:hypothetical protein
MDFILHVIAKVVVPLFFIGMVGSAVVIAVSVVGDVKELLADDE